MSNCCVGVLRGKSLENVQSEVGCYNIRLVCGFLEITVLTMSSDCWQRGSNVRYIMTNRFVSLYSEWHRRCFLLLESDMHTVYTARTHLTGSQMGRGLC